MNDTITIPPLDIGDSFPIQNKWERERAAFLQLLPQLLASHLGKYVVIHDQQVIDTGDDKIEIALRVLRKIGNTDIYVGLVTSESLPIAHSGVRREIR